MRQILRVVVVLIFWLGVLPGAFALNPRYQNMGSSNIFFPTGYVRSTTEYIKDGSHNMFAYSQKVPGDLAEVSVLRHLNGPTKDQSPMNLKIHCLEEGVMMPSVVWGVGDVKEKQGSKIFYVAASKNFESFAVTFHGGVVKDPVTTLKKPFYGLEKVLFPLVTVAGEAFEGEYSLALKARPYPGLDFVLGQNRVGQKDSSAIFKAQYQVPF